MSALLGRGMPGCRLESPLLAREPERPAVLGLVDGAQARQISEILRGLALTAPALLQGDHLVDPTLVADLRAGLRIGLRIGLRTGLRTGHGAARA